MGTYTRILAFLLLSSLAGLPYLAGVYGWGIGTERNPRVIGAATSGADCPAINRDPITGRCRHNFRSYYGRSAMGGGPRHGK